MIINVASVQGLQSQEARAPRMRPAVIRPGCAGVRDKQGRRAELHATGLA